MKRMVGLFLSISGASLVLGKVLVDSDSTFDFKDEEHEVEKGSPPTERINLSVPGTKWCGPGYTAEDYDDLGVKHDEDKCCRAHGKLNFQLHIDRTIDGCRAVLGKTFSRK